MKKLLFCFLLSAFSFCADAAWLASKTNVAAVARDMTRSELSTNAADRVRSALSNAPVVVLASNVFGVSNGVVSVNGPVVLSGSSTIYYDAVSEQLILSNSYYGSTLKLGEYVTLGGDGAVNLTGFASGKILQSLDNQMVPSGVDVNGSGITAGSIYADDLDGISSAVSNLFVNEWTYIARGVFFPSNTATSETFVSDNLSNGDFWTGTISNALQSAWKSNDVVKWKVLAP
jgi:hypothetical protein